MALVTAEKQIRTYSLSESSPVESSMFEVRRSNGVVQRRKANFLVPHRKDYYMLVLVTSGCSRHWVDGVPYTTKPNTFYFATPQQVHVKEQSEPVTGTFINFTEEFLLLEENAFLRQLPIISNPDNGHELILTPGDVAYITDLIDRITVEFESRRDWRNGMLLAYLRVLLIYLSRLYRDQFSNTGDDRFLLRKFRSLIDTHFTFLHQVSDYARQMSITPGHLNDVVKSQSGKTAIEHIHERILLEAKRQLLHTDLSMKEIAYALGFEDAAYFSRFFKRLTGQNPLSFRRAIREMYK